MTNKDRHFKGQLSEETVLCIFRRHWIRVLPKLIFIVIAVLLTALLVYFAKPMASSEAFQDSNALKASFLLGFGLFSFVLHREFLGVFHYYLRTVIITDFRIVDVDRSVFLRDSKDSVDLAKIQDIQKNQNGIFESLFNFGALKIILSGTHVCVDMELVPNPEYYFKVIIRAKREYIRTRREIRIDRFASEGEFYRAPVPIES